MLAGHTHCGQVSIPLLGRLVLPIEDKEYACHLIHENGKALFVTSGIGTTRLPVRFLNNRRSRSLHCKARRLAESEQRECKLPPGRTTLVTRAQLPKNNL
jgi:hypothetical protein